VDVVTDALYALTARPAGSSIRAIADEMHNSRSSTHRILQSLARSGYAEQTDHGGYVVGRRLLTLAARVFGAVPVLQIAHSTMRHLVDEVGETCYLATYTEGEDHTTYVHRVECDHPVRFVQPLGARIPLHAGAVGKAILAALPAPDLTKLELVSYTPHTLTSLPALVADLKGVRERGYSISIEERVLGVAGVAAVVRSGDAVTGALTLSLPTSRLPKGGMGQLGDVVRRHAEELSSILTSMGVGRI